MAIREALAFGKALYDIRTALGLTSAPSGSKPTPPKPRRRGHRHTACTRANRLTLCINADVARSTGAVLIIR